MHIVQGTGIYIAHFKSKGIPMRSLLQSQLIKKIDSGALQIDIDIQTARLCSIQDRTAQSS